MTGSNVTEPDKYRPPDYDNPTGPYSRWAFHTEPQFEQSRETWTAWYPGADWTVTATTKQEAVSKLMAVSIQREDRYASDEAICRRHLEKPIPGIYAMDIGLYNQLRELGECEADLSRAFHEAEQRRVMGQPYTKDDYLRSRGERDA